jgi:hypothetical protein
MLRVPKTHTLSRTRASFANCAKNALRAAAQIERFLIPVQIPSGWGLRVFHFPESGFPPSRTFQNAKAEENMRFPLDVEMGISGPESDQARGNDFSSQGNCDTAEADGKSASA